MRGLALIMVGILIYFLQAQVLPAIFHTNWLPNAVLTAVVVISLFKGRRAGMATAIIGGGLQDILISNFFGLHLFPYIIIVYILSVIKHRMYEERWYWTCAFVAICTIIDGFVRIMMISMSAGDISFFAYMWYMVLPTVFWNALLGMMGHGILQKTRQREEYIW